MRSIVAVAVLSAFSAVSQDAAAAPSPSRARSTQTDSLGCEIMRTGFIDVRNATRRTIPKGTRIEVVVALAAAPRGVRKTVTTTQELSPGLYHAFAPVPRDAKSCSATVRL